MSPRSRYQAMLATYEGLEPAGSDTWNPRVSERELIHRLALYEQVGRALAHVPGDVETLRVLDVGCGTGRSTRVYLDFGLSPSQLMGIDLRAGAIEVARAASPAIRFEAFDGDRLPVADRSVGWMALCTVMSSVQAPGRQHLVAEARRVLAPGGVLFYWDKDTAHSFAGGGALAVADLFPDWSALYAEHVCVYGRIERLLPDTEQGRDLGDAVRRVGHPPSHHCALLRPPG